MYAVILLRKYGSFNVYFKLSDNRNETNTPIKLVNYTNTY